MKIFFFGDSTCFGQFVSPHKIWITQISKQLELEGYDFWLNNISHSGDTTRMALEKMPFDVQSHGLDIFYTQFGMNDCNYWRTDKGVPRVSERAFEANLIEMVERARIFGAKSVMLGVNHMSTKTNKIDQKDFSYQDSNKKYNEIIRSVAKETNAIIIDHEKSFEEAIKKGAKLEDLLLEDQIHLSDEGHTIYFNNIYPILVEAINTIK